MYMYSYKILNPICPYTHKNACETLQTKLIKRDGKGNYIFKGKIYQDDILISNNL